MEILFVSHKYPPATGGMEKQSYELIKGMETCVTVRKIVYTGEESSFQFFRKLNGRILAMIHRYPKISVVHFNDGLIAALSLWHVGYVHLKRVVTLHGLDVVFPWKIYQRFILPRFNRFDQVVTVSKATAKAAIERGIAADKITVIPNGIDHHFAQATQEKQWIDFCIKYDIPQNRRILTTLGRPVKRKGFSWFIKNVLPKLSEESYLVMAGPFSVEPSKKEKWLNRLPARWRELYMLMMGYPSDEQELRGLLCDERYSNQVKHVGKLPQEDLQVLLAEATAFVMPNIRVSGDMEGFGLVCLEASISGAIVIASELEGITDAIHHRKNGLLIEAENEALWVQTLKQLFVDSKAMVEQREAYRNYTLNHFGWDKMVKDYARLFERLQLEKEEKGCCVHTQHPSVHYF
ncbi:glycosyltransferase family 4 protein [Sphingobacterium wenxiniae]|uniref:Glycosyltransferase involved in cell wall bisynthesis n=1 Tax=Sphingobacterium wenxiniae TaxID=683125 RepID=A0A1I6P2Q9_9SPHI|nr:glycosyltransferase family 4 protein [Sphingobacterium wenxiniae]SFS34486.1 Glycosyltransferase involved in cell wall bisynthesis [Sphingobacterium wenxiniae]